MGVHDSSYAPNSTSKPLPTPKMLIEQETVLTLS